MRPALAALALVVATYGHAGGYMALKWDPVEHPDLDHYELAWGTASGQYGNTQNVGTTVEYELALDGPDCVDYFVAAVACDASGACSSSYSNEVRGWPRPRIESVSDNCGVISQPGVYRCVVSGGNFNPDPSGVVIDYTGATVEYVGHDCGTVTFDLTIDASAPPGELDFTIVNAPDRVFGTAPGLLRVDDVSIRGTIVIGLDRQDRMP